MRSLLAISSCGAAIALSIGLSSAPARAQIAISANDGKLVLVDGVAQVVSDGKDTISIVDLAKAPIAKIAELTVETGVHGPPKSIAITVDEEYAFIAGSMKLDAGKKNLVENTTVTVIKLKSAPQVVQTIEAGLGPSGLSVNQAGDMVMVANRNEGTVSVFTFDAKAGKLTDHRKVDIVDKASGPSHVQFLPDGKSALVTRDGADGRISILEIEGGKVTLDKRALVAGIRPYTLDIARDGRFAAVGNVGRNTGDVDTVSLIDLTKKPWRVVDTFSVGQTPEGVTVSPDGKTIAVIAMEGSNYPKANPFHNATGKLHLLSVSADMKLSKVAEGAIGVWSQGAAFSKNGTKIVVGNMVEKNLQVFSWDGKSLKDTGERLPLPGGSAAVRTAEPNS